MMALSDYHWGNPHSTVDFVVHAWRIGLGRKSFPAACYGEVCAAYRTVLAAVNRPASRIYHLR